MRTPAGFECSYFYGNYFRGRSHEECRLIGDAPKPQNWTLDLCKTCPVPSIQRANACPNMVLKPQIKSMFGLRRRVVISAHCIKNNLEIMEPQVGCGNCHSIPLIFKEKE